MADVRFCLLGPLVVRADGVVVPIPKGKQRVVLAALLLKAGRTVTADQLAELLWGSAPPPSAAVTLQNYVKRLRRALDGGADRLVTQPGGYSIRVGRTDLDVTMMEDAVAAAHRTAQAGCWPEAAAQAEAALELWRGEPLSDIDGGVLALQELPRLSELHFQARELRIEAGLHLGEHGELVTAAWQLAADAPLREHTHALLMAALHRDGRRAEALAAYQDARSVLVEQLGCEPGAELQAFHREILDDVPPPPAAPDDRREVPHELPAAVVGFTGRDAELAALDASLIAPPAGSPLTMLISAIGGTAGVGKTALALHWAHRVADRFSDGQLYVNLHVYDPGQPLSAGDALAWFLRALGVGGQDVPAEEGARAAMYRSLLSGRRMLVVLDNARDAEQVRPLLPGAPECATVVTSRDALAGLVARDGARRLDLGLLPLADAISLLRTLIGSRVSAEPGAAAALAGYCGRLPLALRVAAELAAARPAAHLSELADELADRQRRLDLLEAGGDPRAAVREVFSWSLRHLDPGTARAFRLLGLHPGPDLDAYAAAALTGSSLKQAGHWLDQLARAHLIETAGPGRYGLHDLLRDYARELAAGEPADEQQAALTRLFDEYLYAAAAAIDTLHPAEQHLRPKLPPLAVITPSLTEPACARAWLESERANLVAAIMHAGRCGWPRHAIDLAATIFRFLDGGGYLTDAVTVHDHARSAARQTGDVAAEGRALANLAAAEIRQGRDERAAQHFEQALPLSRRAGDRNGEARALGNLGVLAFFQGRYEQAASHYQTALSLQRETGNKTGEAISHCNLAGAQIRLARYEQAASNLQHVLALSRDIGDQDTEAFALLNLGDVSLRQNRHRQAAPYLRQALALSRDLGNRVSEAAALAGLGEVELRQGRYQRAARHLHSALALSRDAGARSAETDALMLLGEVSLVTGDHGQARIRYAEALAVASQAGDPYLQARAHDGLARGHHASRDLLQAREHWRQALTTYTEMGALEAEQIRAQLTTADDAVASYTSS